MKRTMPTTLPELKTTTFTFLNPITMTKDQIDDLAATALTWAQGSWGQGKYDAPRYDKETMVLLYQKIAELALAESVFAKTK